MNKEKTEYYAHLTITVIGIALLLYIGVKYVFVLAIPFLLAWGVAFSVRPLANIISGATRIPERIVRVILTVILIVGGLAVIISASLFALGEAWDFLTELAEGDALYDVLNKVTDPLGDIIGDREGAEELRRVISSAVDSLISSVLSKLGSLLTAFVLGVPGYAVFILVSVIASIYFSLDLEGINSAVKSFLPKWLSHRMSGFKARFLSSLLKYLRAYLTIMLITFIEMLFGFLILGVRYAVLFAFIVALLDALPLIGVGTVLLPWSIYNFIFGDARLGIGILVLFLAHEVVRQLTEPRIVGKNLGIHPVLSLVLLYVGYIVFGFFGLFLIPIASVALNTVFEKDSQSINSIRPRSQSGSSDSEA